MDTTETQETPVVRAARMIKELHLEHIAKMDGGFVFNKRLEDGTLVNCNDEMRAACLGQIELCEKIMGLAGSVPAERLREVEDAMHDVHEYVLKSFNVPLEEEALPEIGNYDYKAN